MTATAVLSCPFLWAHRGASGRAPENTLAAFRAALEDGADGIELDVHLSRDGVPVVIHDPDLERTTNGRGAVAVRTLRELQGLDAGSWFAPEFAGERLPTLEEVFAWAGDRLLLNVEIKDAAAGRAVLLLYQSHPGVRILVSSFDHRLLAHLRRQAPALPLAFLWESRFWHRAVARAAAAGARSFHPRADRTSRQLVRACHCRGLQVFPWTVDSPETARKLLLQGVDGVFTNHVGRLRASLPG